MAAVPKPKAAQPAPKKRKTAECSMFMEKKTAAKKAEPTPSIHLERRASERPAPDAAPKPRGKAAGPPAPKIKSAEIIHSSDDSDIDVEGEPGPVSSLPRKSRRSPSPRYIDQDDEDAEGESDDSGDSNFEVPDVGPSRPRNGSALASLGLGSNLGMVGGFRSPSNGPITLASATNSNQGTPNSHAYKGRVDNVIDFGELGGVEEEDDDDGEVEMEDADADHDVEEMDIGPPARQGRSRHDRKASMATADEDEEDPLYAEMMLVWRVMIVVTRVRKSSTCLRIQRSSRHKKNRS